MNRAQIPRLLFILSCAAAVFAYGVLVGRREIFPFSLLQSGWNSMRQVSEELETLTRLRAVQFLTPARHEGNGVTIHRPEGTAPGLTMLMGFFDRSNEIRLVGLDGSVVNSWPTRFFEIFPDVSHITAEIVPQTEWNLGLHGGHALPDGSVIFNFEGLGLAKLDRCGNVQWTVPRMTHHSVMPAEDGGFWVPGRRQVTDSTAFPFLTVPFGEELLLRVSDSGEVVRELSIPELFVANDLIGLLFGTGLTGTSFPYWREDYTHLNDVEELTSDLAPMFPDFSAGDLLVSLRDRNLLMLVDPDSEQVRWYRVGPWIGQHDPDFLPDGTISVFNNNDDRTDTGSIMGGSNIVKLDPSTGNVEYVYGNDPDHDFYTQIRGNHQHLQNGNILITESGAGRVIEVDPVGEIVWEFINRYDDDEVAVITQATRFPEGYFNVTDWVCP